MKIIAKTLIEYGILITMKEIGYILAPIFIAEVGDIRRFHSASALIAYAGIDAHAFTRQKPIVNGIYKFI